MDRADAGEDRRASGAGSNLTPPLPVIDQQCREIAAATLRHPVGMGRYAGFDAGLAV